MLYISYQHLLNTINMIPCALMNASFAVFSLLPLNLCQLAPQGQKPSRVLDECTFHINPLLVSTSATSKTVDSMVGPFQKQAHIGYTYSALRTCVSTEIRSCHPSSTNKKLSFFLLRRLVSHGLYLQTLACHMNRQQHQEHENRMYQQRALVCIAGKETREQGDHHVSDFARAANQCQ